MESRGQGFQSNYFYIYEFMGEDQDAAAAKEEGYKTELVEESRCWIGWAGAGAVGLAVEQSLRRGVHSPTRLDGGEQDAADAWTTEGDKTRSQWAKQTAAASEALNSLSSGRGSRCHRQHRIRY